MLFVRWDALSGSWEVVDNRLRTHSLPDRRGRGERVQSSHLLRSMHRSNLRETIFYRTVVSNVRSLSIRGNSIARPKHQAKADDLSVPSDIYLPPLQGNNSAILLDPTDSSLAVGLELIKFSSLPTASAVTSKTNFQSLIGGIFEARDGMSFAGESSDKFSSKKKSDDRANGMQGRRFVCLEAASISPWSNLSHGLKPDSADAMNSRMAEFGNDAERINTAARALAVRQDRRRCKTLSRFLGKPLVNFEPPRTESSVFKATASSLLPTEISVQPHIPMPPNNMAACGLSPNVRLRSAHVITKSAESIPNLNVQYFHEVPNPGLHEQSRQSLLSNGNELQLSYALSDSVTTKPTPPQTRSDLPDESLLLVNKPYSHHVDVLRNEYTGGEDRQQGENSAIEARRSENALNQQFFDATNSILPTISSAVSNNLRSCLPLLL